MITRNNISVRSRKDIRLLNNLRNGITGNTKANTINNPRYLVVLDVKGVYRVVSVINNMELKPVITSYGSACYKFKISPISGSQVYNQDDLRRMFNNDGRSMPVPDNVTNMVEAKGVIKFIDQDVSVSPNSLGAGSFNGGFVIGRVGEHGNVGFNSSNAKVHATRELAEEEAVRLANCNPGTEFVVFHSVVGVCKTNVVKRDLSA